MAAFCLLIIKENETEQFTGHNYSSNPLHINVLLVYPSLTM